MLEMGKKRAPLPTETGGVVSIQVEGTDGNRYTFNGTGKVTRTVTQQEDPHTKRKKDITYVEVILTLDESKYQATLPVGGPASADSHTDAWEH